MTTLKRYGYGILGKDNQPQYSVFSTQEHAERIIKWFMIEGMPDVPYRVVELFYEVEHND